MDKLEKERKMADEQQQNAPIFGNSLRSRLEALLDLGKIDDAKKMFQCHHAEAMQAISEFDVKQHKIKSRPDKMRVGQDDYEVCKLTRSIQKTTNNTHTFFMFGNRLSMTMANKKEDAKELEPYFELFLDFLSSLYFDERMFEARQITGAETECAKLYAHYKDEDGEAHVKCIIRSNGRGDILYPMFNQYGDMIAFAFGYFLRGEEDLHSEEHFDVYTKKNIWNFKKAMSEADSNDWELISKRTNEFGKTPVIYYHHEVDWDGSQDNIDRLEWVKSKRGDTTDYFGDPYLKVSSSILDNRLAGAKEIGKLIEVENQDAVFEYVSPPESGDFVKNEMEELSTSINQDTLTPDWSYSHIMGLGTLSGEAMRRVNISGYVKRTQLAVGVYNELIQREINLIKAIMIKYSYIDNPAAIEAIKRLKVKFKYVDPFVGGIDDNSTEIATLMGAGAMSIHAAVEANRNVEDKQAEEERIWAELERKAKIEASAAAKANAESSTENQ